MSDSSKNDIYEVVEGEYYVDIDGSFQTNRRRKEPEMIDDPTLVSQLGLEPEGGQFYVDDSGDIVRDRRTPLRTKTGAIIMGSSYEDDIVFETPQT